MSITFTNLFFQLFFVMEVLTFANTHFGIFIGCSKNDQG